MAPLASGTGTAHQGKLFARKACHPRGAQPPITTGNPSMLRNFARSHTGCPGGTNISDQIPPMTTIEYPENVAPEPETPQLAIPGRLVLVKSYQPIEHQEHGEDGPPDVVVPGSPREHCHSLIQGGEVEVRDDQGR